MFILFYFPFRAYNQHVFLPQRNRNHLALLLGLGCCACLFHTSGSCSFCSVPLMRGLCAPCYVLNGPKFCRAYYRCTHRSSQGCAAIKQVQRTDEDPALFNVFYIGTHTCRVHKAVADQAAAATQPPERNPPDAHSLLQSLTVKTQGLAVAGEQQGLSAASPFGMSSTPASVCLASERSPFFTPSTSDNWYGVSPTTSDSNHDASFPLFDAAEWRAQSEQQEVVSALVAASTPSVPNMDAVTDDELLDIDVSCFFA
jgi:hypothetical protein